MAVEPEEEVLGGWEGRRAFGEARALGVARAAEAAADDVQVLEAVADAETGYGFCVVERLEDVDT